MKEYDVKITETLEKTVTVEAESRDAAEEQVKAAYYNSEYMAGGGVALIGITLVPLLSGLFG